MINHFENNKKKKNKTLGERIAACRRKNNWTQLELSIRAGVKMPGSPDIAITKHKIAVFVDGEFWHGQNWNERKHNLVSNRDYWIEKIEENIQRDQRNDILLQEMGWTSIHFWEKDVLKHLDKCVNSVLSYIQ